jgi:WD40 repeat protein
VALWDLETQKLTGEWNFNESNVVSSLSLRPSNPKIALAGYSNGNILVFDMRISGIDPGSKIWGTNIGDTVVRIKDNQNGPERLYATSSAGKCVAWDPASRGLDLKFQAQSSITCCDVHSALPIVAYAGQRDPAVLCTTSGNVLCTAKGVDPGAIFMFHPILPMITFGLHNGAVLSYEISW